MWRSQVEIKIPKQALLSSNLRKGNIYFYPTQSRGYDFDSLDRVDRRWRAMDLPPWLDSVHAGASKFVGVFEKRGGRSLADLAEFNAST